MADVIQLAEAVAAELADYGAVVALAPEYALRDVKEQRVVVVPVGIAHRLVARGRRQVDLTVQIGVLKKTTEDELVDLVNFVETIAVGFLHRTLCGVRCMKAEHAPLYLPDHLRERRQFTGVVELTFRGIADDELTGRI